MGRPLTVYQEAERIHLEILERNPNGVSMPRSTFDRLMVQGYRKSLDAGRRILETGKAAGFWTAHRNPQARNGQEGWVEVHPATPNLALHRD